MRSSQNKSAELPNKHIDKEIKAINSHHLNIINIIKAAKIAAVDADELPLCPQIPFLRQYGITVPDTPTAVYMIKQSGELLVDKGEYCDPLDENPNMINLGTNPIPCMPMTRREAFKAELQGACHAFFQRPEIRKILHESVSLQKELIEIIVKYR